MTLEGKTALVTGSGRNIGRATALELAKEGANVVINARSNQDEVEAVAEEARELGVRALPILADVSDKEQVDSMAARALEEFGRLDVVVSNVAIRPTKPFMDVSLEEWRLVQGVILDAAFFLSQAALPSMVQNGFGRLIYIAGEGAFTGHAGRAHVYAAKMGLVGLARSLASEVAPHNITVNVVSPGRFDTSRNLDWYPGRDTGSAEGIPVGRMGDPRELGATCRFLSSDNGAFITGQTIHVNGGAVYH